MSRRPRILTADQLAIIRESTESNSALGRWFLVSRETIRLARLRMGLPPRGLTPETPWKRAA